MKFEINGTIYEKTNGNYFYKSTGTMDKKGNPFMRRIAEKTFIEAYDEYKATEEYKNRKEAEAKKDVETEKNFNKTKKESKPRKSKDIAFEMDTIEGHITLTTKQVKFIKLMPKDDFYEHGLESALWIDVFCDTVADQFSPMAVGAMVSTLREKKILNIGEQKMDGKKCKYMTLTIVGQVIAEKLGLK